MREAAYRTSPYSVANLFCTQTQGMSPELSRLRLGMMRPERIADVCRQVHACFADGSETLVPLWHTVALMTLHRFDRLPPHRQSLAVIAGNIAGALDRVGAVCYFDERITSPQMLRTAIRSAQSLRAVHQYSGRTCTRWLTGCAFARCCCVAVPSQQEVLIFSLAVIIFVMSNVHATCGE
ncbi:MAG: hypothetical protein KatS3mg040_0120 [Candidatus Kapaibacterium sp.]|nr:MAG: hypothetical protein KatS3mg040_0120 [Candidatus Kapabacteria bacterium]